MLPERYRGMPVKETTAICPMDRQGEYCIHHDLYFQLVVQRGLDKHHLHWSEWFYPWESKELAVRIPRVAASGSRLRVESV